jgi:predicted aspartyl protease
MTQYRIDHDMIEIPFEYHQHQMFVKVQVNEKQTLTLVVDTGATTLVLGRGSGVKGRPAGKADFKEAEGTNSGEGIYLDSLFLGNEKGMVRVTNITAVLTDTSQLSRVLGKKIDGLLGIAALAGYIVEFDYQEKKLRFYPRGAFSIATREPDNKKTFLLDMVNMNPLSVVSVQMVKGRLHDKYDYDFLFDTGFGGYASVAASAAVESGIMTDKTPRVESSAYSLSRKFSTYRLKASYLKLGELDLAGRTIQVDNRNNGEYGLFGIVGNRLLQNYKVTMDYLRKKIWLERVVENEEPDDIEKPTFGITLRTNGDRYLVDQVTPNSPAHKAGIRSGDTILSIDGKSLEKMTREEIVTQLLSPDREMTLVLQPGVDPNLGVQFKQLNARLKPSNPLEWGN